jgi:recombination associated protein RdgC
MGVLTGGMTVRRFRVAGDVPDGWREIYRDRLNKLAFREPTGGMGKEEVEGWVQVHNLLDTSFDDHNRWLYNQYAVFALRVDKKSLPAKLFKATVQKRCQAWCVERGVEKIPNATKKEIAEKLEAEWLDRTLPRVTLTELCWNVNDGWLLIGGHSDKVADRVRTRFHRTFGLVLVPWSPLDALADARVREAVLASSPSQPGGDA